MDINGIRAACAACFPANRNDCSGFARAVAARVGVQLDGMANDIVNTIRASGNWRRLADGVEANTTAESGGRTGIASRTRRGPRADD